MLKLIIAFMAGVLLCGGMVFAVAWPAPEELPDCPRVVGGKPVDLSRCKQRAVKGAAKPEPYPVRPDLVGPGKP